VARGLFPCCTRSRMGVQERRWYSSNRAGLIGKDRRMKTMSEDENAARFALYRAGCSDREIGEARSCSGAAILLWRNARGLVANFPTKSRLDEAGRAQRMLFYQLGWSDAAIAREQRVTDVVVGRWRHRLGLRANVAPGHRQSRSAPSMSDVFARVRRAIGRYLPRDIADDAVMGLCAALLDGTIPLAEIEAEARKYGNRVLDRFANRFGPRSLDEALPGTEDLRMIDTLVDESSSSWLEEMGATVW
jgi:hypothetical protein